ncbi:MAG: two-component system response regulator [Chloroflexi bacterium HGW-Chloroflexi-6]|nr:MAG: two-component system response regulator [Chloroflexi bacterium HGW-Chloroflexi-6]
MAETSLEILLVEDNLNDAELSLYALKKFKIANSIYHARDGEEALSYLFGIPLAESIPQVPRLILLDLKLPKVDGLEVLRKLKSDPRTQSVPVVVLTSSREERDIVESYHLGVNSYIVKPIDFEQFTEAVRSVGLYWLLLNQSPA